MFTYPITMKDAMRTYMHFIKSAEVKFIDPAVQQFYDDEAAGLCTIKLRQIARQDGLPSGDSELIINYNDPELEFQRRLET
jgi:hypothetical protein